MKNVAALLLVLGCVLAQAHDQEPLSLGFDEKPGSLVPLDLTFRAEGGEPVRLADIVDVPTILMLVFYHCHNACALLPTNLAATLAVMQGEPGRDYRVLTVSFDERETPEEAREKKAIAMSILPPGYPPEAWRFLTGDAPQIRALTDAVGFRFERRGDDFDHPLGLVVISSAGKVVRYMRGSEFLAADVKLALLEASEGRIGATIGKVLRYCLTYDPKSRRLALDIVKVGGAVTLAMMAVLAVFVTAGGRKRREREVKQ